jgi:hypothetical protein
VLAGDAIVLIVGAETLLRQADGLAGAGIILQTDSGSTAVAATVVFEGGEGCAFLG